MSEDFIINVANRVKQLPPYLFGRLNALKYEKRRNNIDIIDLGMGNPNDPHHSQLLKNYARLFRIQEIIGILSPLTVYSIYGVKSPDITKQFDVTLDPERSGLHHWIKRRYISPVFGIVRYRRNCLGS